MRLARGLVLPLFALTVSAAPLAHAQSQLTTPVLRVVEASRASLTLEVEAGATGAPAGFRVEWMRQSDYQALGGWPSDPSSPLLSRAQFYGVPTWNISTGAYVLEAGEVIHIEIGDLFDETGVLATNTGELGDQQTYVVRVQATGSPSGEASVPSGAVAATTETATQSCTFTQGYWKNHPDAWPVTALTLGTQTYTKAQLLSILKQPAKGNGLVILAHQLIATKLNVAGGADATPVASAIADADALIGALLIPPVGSGFLDPDDVSVTSQILDSFNNGNLGIPHCGATPAQPTTWGNLKARYR